MKLFSFDIVDYALIWEPQTLMIEPFAKLFKRDKTKGKTRANNELAFVWFFADIKSDYQIHTNDVMRTKHIVADLKMKSGWAPDKLVMDAIDYYNKMSGSITASILKDSMYIAEKLSKKMREAVEAEDLDINEMTKLLEGIKKMPGVIHALQEAEQAVLKEIKKTQDSIGSKEKALFEDVTL